jgi:signal peptidase I
MLPTLQPEDLVLTRPSLPGIGTGLPRRGDLVVVRLPATIDRPEVTAIKRVVGLPGDTVVLGDGHLHVDGSWWDLPGALLVDEDLRLEVGADQVAVLGDNRAMSTDSRQVGPLPIGAIERVVLASVDPPRRVGAGIGMRRVDGPRRREAVRVVVVDPDDRTLLFRVRDRDGGDDRWWETPGGGLHPGESVMAAARREVAEEVGADHGELVSLDHVATRTSSWWGTEILRVEHTLATRVQDATVTTANWTAAEHEDHVSWRWVTTAELAELDDPIIPLELPELLPRALASTWVASEDGAQD